MEDPGNPALEAPPKRVFESERLRMRTTTMGDVDAMIPIMTNPETMLYTCVVVAPIHEISVADMGTCRRGVVNVTSRSVAETWLKTRCMGRDVLSFMITLKPDEAKRRGFDGSQEHVVGILGGHHPPEIGYILHIGIFDCHRCHTLNVQGTDNEKTMPATAMPQKPCVPSYLSISP